MDEQFNSGFLSGYIEANVELPMDGLNGECIVHFYGDHSNDELVVTLVNGRREGMAFLLCDGLPTLKCEYRNGTFIGNAKKMDKWECLLFIVSKGINSEDSLLSYDTETVYTYGVIKYNSRYYVVDWFRDDYHMVIADVNRKEMIVYENGNRIDSQCVKEVIDLDVNGRRWEGGVKDEKPFGYGVLYDEEGRKEYEGFMMDGMRVCYGMEYNDDTERVRYIGCFYNDKRCGKGVLYDRNGTVDYDGLWKNDKPSTPRFDDILIDIHTESIEIVNNSFNEVNSFIPLFFLHSLKRMVIGDECFERVRVFELNGLGELESVVIGKKSFTYDKTLSDLWKRENSNGSYRMVNCPKLKSIHIGDYSFAFYSIFELNSLPSLQSIGIGGACFYWVSSFSLTGLSG